MPQNLNTVLIKSSESVYRVLQERMVREIIQQMERVCSCTEVNRELTEWSRDIWRKSSAVLMEQIPP